MENIGCYNEERLGSTERLGSRERLRSTERLGPTERLGSTEWFIAMKKLEEASGCRNHSPVPDQILFSTFHR